MYFLPSVCLALLPCLTIVLAANFFMLGNSAEGVALPLVKPFAILPRPLLEPHLPFDIT